MKRHLLYLCLIFLAHSAMAATDTTITWIDQVRTLRDAIYHRDKETVKTFFNFPFKDDQFWEYARQSQLSEKKPAVTEKLFDLYFDEIFDKKFISTFLKIKTKDLYEKDTAKSPEFTEDQEDYYYMEATYDEDEQRLELALRGYNNVVDDPSDWSRFLVFRLVDGKFKFEHTAILP